MRIIPKKSKVNATVWRSFTIFDILLAFVLFGIGVLIAMSNFEYKWAILLGYASISIMLFFGEGDERAYNDLVYMFKYTVSPNRNLYQLVCSEAKDEVWVRFPCPA